MRANVSVGGFWVARYLTARVTASQSLLEQLTMMQQIPHINGELFAKINLAEPEMIRYKSFDGRRIQAWAQRPPDFQPGKKYRKRYGVRRECRESVAAVYCGSEALSPLAHAV
jgi:hypothetical protein